MSAPKTEFLRIAEALERLVTITEKLVDTLSASPAPVVPSVVKSPSSPSPQRTLSPGEDTALDDALTPYLDRLRPSKGPDGRPWYYTQYEKGEAARSRWIAINAIMQAHSYVWISDKKNSHWEPKEAPAK